MKNRLNSRERMQLIFCRKVCIMRKPRGIKHTQVTNFFVDGNLRDKFSRRFPETDAQEIGFIILMRFFKILSVLCVCCFSKVCNAIVRSIPVNMVNLVCGPSTIDVQESEAMGRILLAVDSKNNVAISRNTPGDISCAGAICFATNKAGEYPGIRVVAQKFFEPLCCEWDRISLAHNRSFKALSGSDGRGLVPLAVALS